MQVRQHKSSPAKPRDIHKSFRSDISSYEISAKSSAPTEEATAIVTATATATTTNGC